MYSFCDWNRCIVKDYDTYCEKVNILIIDCFDVFVDACGKNLTFSKKRLDESRGPNNLPSLKPTNRTWKMDDWKTIVSFWVPAYSLRGKPHEIQQFEGAYRKIRIYRKIRPYQGISNHHHPLITTYHPENYWYPIRFFPKNKIKSLPSNMPSMILRLQSIAEHGFLGFRQFLFGGWDLLDGCVFFTSRILNLESTRGEDIFIEYFWVDVSSVGNLRQKHQKSWMLSAY